MEGDASRASGLRLHLGCGRYYLDGYVNIDYPPAEHTVQRDIRADVYRDIVSLDYAAGSVEEIRLHHVFEHFPRPTALALICRWRDWLEVGGTLRIETPDLRTSLSSLVSPFVSYSRKQQVIRHLFGSHESKWAVHWDGWYEARFRHTLTALGFSSLSFKHTKWGALRNVEVIAAKDHGAFSFETYLASVEQLFKESLILDPAEPDQVPDSELQLLNVWIEHWKQTYQLKQA